MVILDLQFSVRGQNRSESHQEDTCDNTKMKQAKTDVSKLKKYPFQVKQALRKFSEAARDEYLTNDNNIVLICHFEFEISEFEKETTKTIFKFYLK